METKDSPYYLGNSEVPPTVLVLKHHDKVVTIELPWDAGTEDLLDAFTGACVGVTFDQEGVLEAMKDYAEERLPQHQDIYEDE